MTEALMTVRIHYTIWFGPSYVVPPDLEPLVLASFLPCRTPR
jgi:hypothetical protein